MAESADLVAILQASHPDIQEYVAQLKTVNAKLHKRIYQLEAENVSLENRIEAIKDGNPLPQDAVSTEEIEQKLVEAVRKMGYKVTKTS